MLLMLLFVTQLGNFLSPDDPFYIFPVGKKPKKKNTPTYLLYALLYLSASGYRATREYWMKRDRMSTYSL